MRPLGWFAAFALVLSASACATQAPVAPVAHVSESHALRVSFKPPRAVLIDFRNQPYTPSEVKHAFDGAEDATAEFNRRLGETLQRAGYRVVEDGPHDVRVIPRRTYAIESRQSRHGSLGSSELVRVVLHVYAPNGEEIDRLEVHSEDEESQLGSPLSVAVDLVNAMVQSRKLSRYAEARR